MRSSVWVLLLVLFTLAAARTTEEKEAMQKNIRMKTSRQLKEIFDELGIGHKGLSKDDLRKKAYKEDALTKWEKLHPDKKQKPRKGGMPDYGGGGGGGFGGDPKVEEMMRQMRGDFSTEKDPERRRILEKLAKKGMSFGGGSSMDTEQLRNMEKMMDGMGDFKGGGGDDFKGAESAEEIRSHGGDDDMADEDKIEL